MIFLHNGGADLQTWCKQLEHFAKTHRVLAFDFLGYGLSDRPDMVYDLELQVEQLDRFLRHKKIDSAILVGNCVGASTAIEFAQRYPERAELLILGNICGGTGFFPWLALLMHIPGIFYFCVWFYARFLYDPAVLWGKRPQRDDPLWQHFWEQILQHPGFFRSRYNMTLGTPSFAKFAGPLELREDFPPNILFWGQQNKLMPYKFAQQCLEYLLSERLFALADSGHFCFYEQSDKVNREIERFLGDCDEA